MPEYYRHTLANGKTVMETAPTIQWGYLIYLTVLRLCQYFGAQGGVRVLRHQPQLAPAQAGGPPVHRASSRSRTCSRRWRSSTATTPTKASKAYTLTGGSVTSTVDGLAEADFYGRYAQAIEERFPGRWIGKVVAQALPQRGRAALQGLRDHDLPPELRGLGQAALRAHLARARSATSAARSGTGGSSTRRRCSAPRYVIPNFVAGVEMAKPFGFATVDEAIASARPRGSTTS